MTSVFEKAKNESKKNSNIHLGLFLFGLSAIMVILIIYLSGAGVIGEYVTLPLIVVFGVTLFLGSLVITTIVLSNLNLTNKSQALGLPQGSIRALIALSLIIIFAIMVIYMQFNLQQGSYLLEDGTYEQREPSVAQKEFALQSLTIVGTLVTSLAVFYFGTAAVKTARGGGAPDINVTPESLVDLDVREQTVLYPIKVITIPNNEAIYWAIDDAKHGSLTPLKPNEFKYKIPEDKKIENGTIVTLTFNLVKYPNVSENLKIKIINPPPEATTPTPETTDKDKKDKTEKID